MVTRLIVICLCLGLVSIVNGCAVGSSPALFGTLAPYWTLSPPETSQGPDDARQSHAMWSPVVSVSTQRIEKH